MIHIEANHIVGEIYAERVRQLEKEGWTPDHDDREHQHGELSMAAAAYAVSDKVAFSSKGRSPHLALLWPWAEKWWKPKTRRRDLIRAGALIVAEIERLDRIKK